jgi:DNA helicase HerA-like ATPase
MSDLYSTLPEVGDQPLPRLVFFFDEAHMLFDGTSKAMVDKIEQVVRLIRSKGVGIYFVTQNPIDIPETILGQLGNRVEHALRAFTPKDQKAVRTAAETFRPNPAFDTEEAITTLGTGEALVSFLDAKGAPSMVQKAKILFPLSQIGAITSEQRESIIRGSRLYGKYDTPVDRQSAFEDLLKESEEAEKAAQEEKEVPEDEEKKTSKKKGLGSKILGAIFTAVTASVASSVGSAVSNKVTGKKSKSTSVKNSAGKAVRAGTSAATRTITREITRSILGNLIK